MAPPDAATHTAAEADIDRDVVTRTLRSRGESFALRAPPEVPWYRTAGRACLGLAALPVLAPVGLLWLAAMAVPRARDLLLSLVVPRIMANVDREFQRERRTLLRNVSGKVLDVGSGGGAYLQYLRNAEEVVAVEPNAELHARIREAGRDLARLTILRDLGEIDAAAHGTFDWAILGNVLCEVPDVPTALRQLDALLRPGGRLYFSEHIAHPSGTWRRRLQDQLNPLWRFAGGGCNCNRESLREIQRLDYEVVSWRYDHVTAGLGPFVLGLAVKPGR